MTLRACRGPVWLPPTPDGTCCVFLESAPLYQLRDLYSEGDGEWLAANALGTSRSACAGNQGRGGIDCPYADRPATVGGFSGVPLAFGPRTV
jgi:hypothetical protein